MNEQSTFNLSRRGFLGGGLTVGALGLAAVALPGCSKAANSSSSSASHAAQQGGTLHLVQTADIQPSTLLAQNNPNFSVCRTVFNTLTEYNHKTLQPEPSLATAWKVADGGKTYVLTLRSDVKYHSGRPFGPDDVVGVIKYLQLPSTSSQLKSAAALCTPTKTGANEVTLSFSQPINNVFDLFEIMIMIDPQTTDGLAAGKTFNGTGPFSMVDYRPNAGFTLKRNESYWKSARPYLDSVEVSVVTQSSSALAALQSGQAQLALDLAPQDAAGLKSSSAINLIQSDAHDSVFYVGQNVTVHPLDQLEVRQAVAWAIDRDRILSQVLGGIGQVSSLPWAASSPAYDAGKAGSYHFDAAKAKQMIASAGASGAAVKLFYNAGLATNAAIAEIVQFNLTQAGLKVSPQPLQAADFLAQLSGDGLPGLFINGHGFGQMHPPTLVKGAFPFNAAGNAEKFSSPAYTALAAQMWTTTDAAAAKGVYAQVNDLLVEQQFVSDLVVSSHTYATAKSVQGVAWTMLDYLNFDDTYLSS